MKPYAASIGSVSHGTLRTEDLLEAFSDELARLAPDDDLVREARALLTLTRAGWFTVYAMPDAVSDLVNDLHDALSVYAPPYCYFGGHEGDGSDFGFWPDLAAIEELPKVSDPNEVDAMDVDCVYVNDHGNVTVYGADGRMLWNCV